MDGLVAQIFGLQPGDDAAFTDVWDAVYAFQVKNCTPYNRYCNGLPGVTKPYFPIEAFKRLPVISFENPDDAALVFASSGTGKGIRAQHFVKEPALYERAILTHFRHRFGEKPITIAGYLPHYTAMGKQSSLLYMVDYLLETSGDAQSGFFLGDEEALASLAASAEQDHPFLLFGAAFGLLDLLEQHAITLPAHAQIIETGGMKTYRREITRDALHQQLATGFGIPLHQVISEYGMCELLSQCYTAGGHTFFPPPWMRFKIMKPEDPLTPQDPGKPGALAVIDLANLYSVSAILTQDKAVQVGDGFEVLGRLEDAALRGCNFLLEQG